MNEVRPYASLSSGLLARKGSARPAMRPQGYGGFEDLGWNDMGVPPPSPAEAEALPQHVPSSIAALTPMGRGEEPSVVAQQRAIAESFAESLDGQDEHEQPAPSPAPQAPADIVPLPRRVRASAGPARGRKAAFTLRLDPERHLRLRLACALAGRSAQQLVTAALDEKLATIPELDTMAERVPAKGRTRG